MLNMTREFLIKAHNAFDELGYRPNHLNFNYDHFCECATKTLNRTEELQDAIEAAKLWQFVNSHFGKIHQLANKHEHFGIRYRMQAMNYCLLLMMRKHKVVIL